jgi:hypothetical protein
VLVPTEPVAPSTLMRLGAGIAPGRDVAAGTTAIRPARSAGTPAS